MLRFLHFPIASARSTVLLLLSLTQSSICYPGSSLSPRTVIPAPIVYSPSQNWEGVDGYWNSFVLRIGTPPQTVRVQISTASQQTWVIDPRGCPDDTAGNTSCSDSRGTTFNYENSKSWKTAGLYELWTESNLGLYGNAEYGKDNVSLAYEGEGGPSLQGQTVGALATTDFYFGHFGLDPKPTNFTDFADPQPSFLHSLKEENKIPSVSWGFTAGASYRFNKVPASLTLGGVDSSKFIQNGVSFTFAPDNERDILVRLRGINSIDASGNQTPLQHTPIYVYIDSTIAEFWLPLESCLLFEQKFGLTWDPVTDLYLLSDAAHNQLLVTNPNITFTIGSWNDNNATSLNTVNITLPYAAFDLTAQVPYQQLNKSSRYFPLRRAANETQYTFGRTFLQEAYLVVDWERQNFSVSQVSWAVSAPAHIVPILSLNSTANNTTGGAQNGSTKVMSLSAGAIAGIAIGVVFILLLTAAMAWLVFKGRKQPPTADGTPTTKTVDTESSKDEEASGTTLVFPKAELPAETVVRAEADGTFYGKNALGRSATSSTAPLVESDSKEREVFEMEGDMPSRQEADGRQLTEKDAMKAREERINGVDPSLHSPVSNSEHSPSSVSPPSTLDTNRRRQLLTGGDIIELSPVENRTHMPISPLDGSDGSRTNLFSPISPGGATMLGGVSPADATRKRFSYEDP